MRINERVVLDSNTLISRLLFPDSIPGRAARRAMLEAQVLASEATLDELADVLSRKKFDRYVRIEDRSDFLALIKRVARIVPITYVVRVCRDPSDDKVLEVAVNGDADLIVTGDRDLLALDPFRDIPIVTPARYLAR